MKKLLYLICLTFIGCSFDFTEPVIIDRIDRSGDNCVYFTADNAFTAPCGEFNIGDTVKIVKY